MLGFEPKIVFCTRGAIFYRDIAAWGGDLPNGVSMELIWGPSIKNAVGIGDTTPQSLATRFYEETGEPLAQGIGWEYMGMQILFDAIERAGTLDSDAVLQALSATDLNSIFGRVVFDPGTQFHAYQVQCGQWQKTDNPWVWEAECVYSDNDNMPATAELIFPVPYD